LWQKVKNPFTIQMGDTFSHFATFLARGVCRSISSCIKKKNEIPTKKNLTAAAAKDKTRERAKIF